MGRIIGLTFPVDEAGEGSAQTAEEYICPHCGKVYKSKASLSKHINDKHFGTADAPEN